MDYVLPQPGSHSMGGWTGCPASADSPPRPLGERTPRAPSVLKPESLSMQRVLPTPAPYVSVWKKTFKFLKKTVKRGMVGGSAGGIGVWSIEEEAEAATVVVAQLQHCITDNHKAGSVEEKERAKKYRKNLGSAAVLQIYLSKKSGVIISIQMTALCRCIHD